MVDTPPTPISNPSPISYTNKLRAAWAAQGSMLCVGLDPDPRRYPPHLANTPDRVYAFCKAIVDATAPYACAFKPQIAYFAAQAAEPQLERLCAYIRSAYPTHVLVLDSKRGDIGDTAKQYAVEAFERYHADAVTVNPYMGFDSITPYLAHTGKGVIVLCRTSNAGGSDLQALALDAGGKLYERVAHLAASQWNASGQLSLVVGATFPAELATVRHLVGDMPLLVPGIGAQGGDVQATVSAGKDSAGYGMMINSSRAILYASSGLNFAADAAKVAQDTRDAIRQTAQTPESPRGSAKPANAPVRLHSALLAMAACGLLLINDSANAQNNTQNNAQNNAQSRSQSRAPQMPDPLGAFIDRIANTPQATLEAASDVTANVLDAAQRLVTNALGLIGVRYAYGGNTVEQGLDCSGFVKLVFQQTMGLSLPRQSAEMSKLGESVGQEALLPGDLVFFNTLRRSNSHVGIYIGEGQFVHSPSSGGKIRVENMAASYWQTRYDGAKRINVTPP